MGKETVLRATRKVYRQKNSVNEFGSNTGEEIPSSEIPSENFALRIDGDAKEDSAPKLKSAPGRLRSQSTRFVRHSPLNSKKTESKSDHRNSIQRKNFSPHAGKPRTRGQKSYYNRNFKSVKFLEDLINSASEEKERIGLQTGSELDLKLPSIINGLKYSTSQSIDDVSYWTAEEKLFTTIGSPDQLLDQRALYRVISRKKKLLGQAVRQPNDKKTNNHNKNSSEASLHSTGSTVLDLISSDASIQLKEIGTWDKFDVFSFSEACNGRPLLPMMEYLFRFYDLYEKLNISVDISENFFYAIESLYRPVTYHNSIHAADVVQAFHFFVQSSNVQNCLNLEDIFVGLIAAAVHDVNHPGNNNAFEINTHSDLAITYNDKSVLENFHLATTFRVLKSSNHNIFASFPKTKFVQFRQTLIKMVLATDMQEHNHYLNNLKNVISERETSEKSFTSEEKDLILQNGLHVADISNCTRPLKICVAWTPRIYEEFLSQGDKERELGLPISICDRKKPEIEKSQVGFISFVIKPLFSTWVKVVPEASVCVSEMDKNLEYWREKASNSNTTP